ncbi:MAG: hypothetical protein HY922_04605 [Elusimicrobia bacterium]|nr:hypothetical protein [Elusimicrobiota bacterium]
MNALPAIFLALSALLSSGFGQARAADVAPAKETAAARPPSGKENSSPPGTALPSAPPGIAKLKADIREALLDVRRARYAQRKAKKAANPEAAKRAALSGERRTAVACEDGASKRAETRLKEAKSRLKDLRTELRAALRKSP